MNSLMFACYLLVAPVSLEQISEALGHLIGKHIDNLELTLDLDALARGIAESKEGKPSPMNEEECLSGIATLQKQKECELARKNTEEAEQFLSKNEKSPDIHTLADGKLQYQIAKKGTGQLVAEYNAPIVRIAGHYIDGKAFTTPYEEELLILDESIPAFRLGVQGMREGETRVLFVHPDLGYGDEGHLRPGALLIFEVELVRADAANDQRLNLEPPLFSSVQ